MQAFKLDDSTIKLVDKEKENILAGVEPTMLNDIVNAINAVDSVVEIAVRTYVESCRLTWKNYKSKLFLKTKTDALSDKIEANHYERLLYDVYKWQGSVYELALERGLILKGGVHPHDPPRNVRENTLSVKGRDR